MKQRWPCVVHASRQRNPEKGSTTIPLDTQLFPFMVEAFSYAEASATARRVMERMEAANLLEGFGNWCVFVNEQGEAGLVTDPELVDFELAERHEGVKRA